MGAAERPPRLVEPRRDGPSRRAGHRRRPRREGRSSRGARGVSAASRRPTVHRRRVQRVGGRAAVGPPHARGPRDVGASGGRAARVRRAPLRGRVGQGTVPVARGRDRGPVPHPVAHRRVVGARRGHARHERPRPRVSALADPPHDRHGDPHAPVGPRRSGSGPHRVQRRGGGRRSGRRPMALGPRRRRGAAGRHEARHHDRRPCPAPRARRRPTDPRRGRPRLREPRDGHRRAARRRRSSATSARSSEGTAAAPRSYLLRERNLCTVCRRCHPTSATPTSA